LVVVFAAVLRAFTGFGFALAAVPVFSMLMPPLEAVVLSVMLTLAVSVSTLRTYWGETPIKPMLPMIVASLLGTLVGAMFLGSVSTDSFQLWVGLSVIAACAVLTFYKPAPKPGSASVGALAGLSSGLLNGVFAIPGPPMVVYAVATQPSAIQARSLLMTFFLFSAGFGVLSYALAGYVNKASWMIFAISFPAMFLGDKLGYRLFTQYGTRLYKTVALIALFAVGFATTGRALLEMARLN
jgi:uncharacterized membrane protein YfcA